MPSAGVTTAGKIGHIPSLNGLRAAAIAVVIWAHAGFPGNIAGSMGVSLFFFLSGYLITTLLRVEADRFGRISLKGFYLRRTLRIFPPMYLVLATVIVLSLLSVLPNTMTVGGTVATAAFFTNYWIIFEGHEGVPAGLGVFWSLAVEEHFYLIFPLFYIGMRRWLPNRSHQIALLVGLCVAILGWRLLLWSNGADPLRLYYATDTRADALLWGAVMAIGFNPMYGEVRLPRAKWLTPAIVIVCAAVFFASSKLPGHYTLGFTVQSLAAFGILIPLILAPRSWIGRPFNWRPIAWVGVVSYSLYLTHRWALIAAEEWIAAPHIVWALTGIAAAVLMAWGMRVWIERPLEKARKRLSRTGERPEEPLLGEPRPATEPEREPATA